MFIRINRTPKDGNSQLHISVYECSSYHLFPIEGTTTTFMLTMEGHQGSEQASYDTEEEDLYISSVNERGRTIDVLFQSA